MLEGTDRQFEGHDGTLPDERFGTIEQRRQALERIRGFIKHLYNVATPELTSSAIGRHLLFNEGAIADELNQNIINPAEALEKEKKITIEVVDAVLRAIWRCLNQAETPEKRQEWQQFGQTLWEATVYTIRGQDFYYDQAAWEQKLTEAIANFQSLPNELAEALNELAQNQEKPEPRSVLVAGIGEDESQKSDSVDADQSDDAESAEQQVRHGEHGPSYVDGLSAVNPNERTRKMIFGETGEPVFVGDIETEDWRVFEQPFINEFMTPLASGDYGLISSRYQVVSPEALVDTEVPRASGETDITLPVIITDPDQVIALPVPLGYELIGVDRQTATTTIERSNLGMYRLTNLDPSLRQVRYRICQKEKQEPLVIESRAEWDRSFPLAKKQDLTQVADALALRAKTREEKARIIAGGIRSVRPVYADDPIVGICLDACGKNRYLAYEAFQTGHCDSLSAHLINRLRSHGIPAVAIGGMIPVFTERQFKANNGHTQVLYLDESGQPKVIEATALADQRKNIDWQRIELSELEALITALPGLSPQELFDRISALAKQISYFDDSLDHSLRMQQQLPEWVDQRQVPGLEHYQPGGGSTDTTSQLIQALDFLNRWESFKGQGRCLTELPQLYREHRGIYFAGAQEAAEKLLPEGEREEFSKKLDTPFLLDMCNRAVAALDPNSPESEADREWFRKWVMAAAFDPHAASDAWLSPKEAHQILELDYLLKQDPATILRVCEQTLPALERYHYTDSVSDRQLLEDVLTRLETLTNALGERYRGRGHPPVELTKNHSYDIISQAGQICHGLSYTAAGASATELLVNFCRLTGNKEQAFLEAIFPYAHTYDYVEPENQKAWMSHAHWLGIDPTLTHWLTTEGELSAEGKTKLKEYFYDTWLPTHGLTAAISGDVLNYLATLGIDTREFFEVDRMRDWIQSVIPRLTPPVLNMPTAPDGESSDRFPVSRLFFLRGDRSNYHCSGLVPLESLYNLEALSGIHGFVDAVRDIWPETDEQLVLGAIFDNVTIDDYPDRTTIDLEEWVTLREDRDAIDWLRDLRTQLPKKYYTQAAEASPLVACLMETTIPKDLIAWMLWQEIYNRYPEAEQIMTNKIEALRNSKRRVESHILYEQRLDSQLTTERLYFATLMLESLFPNELSAADILSRLDQIQALGESCRVASDELPADQQPFPPYEQLADLVEKYLGGFAGFSELKVHLHFFAHEPKSLFQFFVLIAELARLAKEEIQEKFGATLEQAINDKDQSTLEKLTPQVSRLMYRHFTPILRNGVYDLYEPVDNLVIFVNKPTILARQFDTLLRRAALQTEKVKEEEVANVLQAVRRRLSQQSLPGVTTSFARYLSEFFNVQVRGQDRGAEFEFREYQPGDDIAQLDWNSYARNPEKPYVRISKESMTNPVYILVDLEWLAESSHESGPPERLEQLFTLLFLGQRERIPLHFRCYMRGELMVDLGAKELKKNLEHRLDPDIDQYHDEHLFSNIWCDTNGLQQLLEKEAKEKVVYPPRPMIRETWYPHRPATVLTFVSEKNRQPTNGIVSAFRSYGLSVRQNPKIKL